MACRRGGTNAALVRTIDEGREKVGAPSSNALSCCVTLTLESVESLIETLPCRWL
jgi:hypothetical protein